MGQLFLNSEEPLNQAYQVSAPNVQAGLKLITSLATAQSLSPEYGNPFIYCEI